MGPHTVFVSHGGGPLPILGDAQHKDLVKSLQQLSTRLPRHPRAILVISAHWEAEGFTITSSENPGLLYDYYGFPKEAYTVQYPAKGSPQLAQEWASELARLSGLPVKMDSQRRYDHGVFVPLLLMYPEADVPVLQLSLDQSLDPALHWRMGQALMQVIPDDVVVIGSGFSFHNLPLIFRGGSSSMAKAEHFLTWLDEVVTDRNLSTYEREERWRKWESAPEARINHPKEEHLIPLLMCSAMMADRPGEAVPVDIVVPSRHYSWL
uniref:Extradiol ring-cleavage dioxygenase class III enzyme subunit B domain-containing protein n=1 Tax=Compsopogon caeruleus TaxID=31354 RepID=A0A7S1THN4_9RHOD|mmetsp:Transcript_7441/g.15181  ORF Transcript_7441/g.15181 Transcript_7441/m.15181 type:complete len:265 (+) Transcript_7441:264-1058(+)|eukprot:CAMPEP_0184687712 /NCGR_PEP_ID=MMETSP0312-20130426/27356_1 /TAXON_ID=31354 /ORGANISM="Compsopogon coeruleus, Strain SAG 36.94" /LENGTH=264 /DNA_ID=CAMNT_0027144137 /DNA_START=240 /DNA_END=1034 /DNA_ORIENTATION=-